MTVSMELPNPRNCAGIGADLVPASSKMPALPLEIPERAVVKKFSEKK